MGHKWLTVVILSVMLFRVAPSAAAQTVEPEQGEEEAIENAAEEQSIEKVLFIGDSMTGWMAERLNAYGEKNGFEVATVVWDGSTIRKWGGQKNLATRIRDIAPDAIFISLGLNELFETNPENRLSASLESILRAVGDIPCLWIGPPSWPGRSEGGVLNGWLAEKLGEGHYFRSDALDLQRQSKTNPHPSRSGIIKWIDAVVEWIPEHTDLKFNRLERPDPSAMSRGKVFIYKRMQENL